MCGVMAFFVAATWPWRWNPRAMEERWRDIDIFFLFRDKYGMT